MDAATPETQASLPIAESVATQDAFNRPALVAALAAKTGLPRAKANEVLEATLGLISEALTQEKQVRLPGFGVFVVGERKASKGRDPRTGAEIDLPESKTVRFRPSQPLRDRVNATEI